MTTLLDAVCRHAEANADWTGIAQTPIPGLMTARATAPSDLLHAVSRPTICLVLQGAKHVTVGTKEFDFAAGDSLLITADVPTVSQITRASVVRPYCALVERHGGHMVWSERNGLRAINAAAVGIDLAKP